MFVRIVSKLTTFLIYSCWLPVMKQWVNKKNWNLLYKYDEDDVVVVVYI